VLEFFSNASNQFFSRCSLDTYVMNFFSNMYLVGPCYTWEPASIIYYQNMARNQSPICRVYNGLLFVKGVYIHMCLRDIYLVLYTHNVVLNIFYFKSQTFRLISPAYIF
jgi:hypothetical protein